MTKIYLSICTFLILSFTQNPKTEIARYCNDRFGYTAVELILYADSTYKFDRWNHMSSIVDYGKWKEKDSMIYISSSKKSQWKTRGRKSKREYLFINDSIRLSNDTLRVLSKNERTKRTLYDLEYKLFKCPGNN